MQAWAFVADAVACAAALGAISATSLTIARRLGVRGLPDRVLASLVLAAAQIVLTVEALSLLGRIARVPLLAVHAVVALAIVRELPRGPLAWRRLRDAWNGADLPLRLMAGATAAAAVAIAFNAILVPVRHDDSISYHLPRAAIYLQQGSLDAFSTPDLRQTMLPANAEILTLWQMAVSGRNAGGPLVQAVCWLGAALAVFRLARHVVASQRPAAFAGLAFASLPGVMLQATTAQNDLTTAFFVLCTLVFARSGLADRRHGELAIAGIALGLALGTKATAILGTPALALLVMAESVRARRLLRRETSLLALFCAAGFLLFGSYLYVQNLRRYGHLTGSAAFVDLGALPRIDPKVTWSNLVRLALRLSEPAGLIPPGTPPAVSLEHAHARFAQTVRSGLGVEARRPQDLMKGLPPEHAGLPIDADVTTFGPLFAVAGLPVLLHFAFRRRVDASARALAWGALAYVVGLASLLRYNIHLGRFLVVMVAIEAPLLAPLYREGRDRLSRWGNLGLAIVCSATLGLCVAVRGATPVLRTALVSPASGSILLSRPDRPEAEVAGRLFDRLPPGRIALVSSVGAPVHPLFDRTLTRVVRLVRGHQAPAEVRSADYVLLWGETQIAIGEGELRDDPVPWVEIYDLRPLLGDMRSSWHPILDGSVYMTGGFHLFARRRLSLAERAVMPDVLPSSPPLGKERGGGTHFSLPVRLDAARPSLLIRGEIPPHTTPVIEIRGPAAELLSSLSPPAGFFEERVSLAPLIQSESAPYAVLTFESSSSSQPSRGGEVGDGVWRSSGFALVAP